MAKKRSADKSRGGSNEFQELFGHLPVADQQRIAADFREIHALSFLLKSEEGQLALLDEDPERWTKTMAAYYANDPKKGPQWHQYALIARGAKNLAEVEERIELCRGAKTVGEAEERIAAHSARRESQSPTPADPPAPEAPYSPKKKAQRRKGRNQ